jgi:hypothetical protein
MYFPCHTRNKGLKIMGEKKDSAKMFVRLFYPQHTFGGTELCGETVCTVAPTVTLEDNHQGNFFITSQVIATKSQRRSTLSTYKAAYIHLDDLLNTCRP